MLYTVYKHFVLQDKNLTFQYDVDDNYFEITDIISGLKDKFGEDKVDTLIDNAMRHNANSEKDVKAFNHYLIQSPITRELMTNPCNLMIDNKISRHNFDFHSLASWFESNPQQSPDGFLPIQESSTVGISPNYDARDEIKRFLNKIEDILEKKYNESNESRQRLTHRN